MPLSDQEMNALEIVAKYNFLTECEEKGYISQEKYAALYNSFGLKSQQMVNFYLERLDEHFKDTSQYLDSLKPKKLSDTVDGIADQIIEDLPPKERKNLSKLPEKALEPLQMALGLYSKKQLDEIPADENVQDLNDANAPANIIRRVWEKLRGDDE